MSDYNSHPQHVSYLSAHQQDLLLAALASNNPPPKDNHLITKLETDGAPHYISSSAFSISPNALDGTQSLVSTYENPLLDFNPRVDFDYRSDDLSGSLPGTFLLPDEYEPGEKRKGIQGKLGTNHEESGKKRRESGEKVSRKPGRKPLTSEPTTKRKAQNRAAQRAFRERKEQHLKDLETKISELQKASDSANEENNILRAQIERMQVELREYRARISYLASGSGTSALNGISSYPRPSGPGNNDFFFDFPKFGDLPGSHLFNSSQAKRAEACPPRDGPRPPGILSRDMLGSQSARWQPADNNSSTKSQAKASLAPQQTLNGELSGETSRCDQAASGAPVRGQSIVNTKQVSAVHDSSSSDSPSSSYDSRQSNFVSSNGTSPESSPNFSAKPSDGGKGAAASAVDDQKSFCDQLSLACGTVDEPVSTVGGNLEGMPSCATQGNQGNVNGSSFVSFGLDVLAHQNGGQFDPVLFGDWREPQDSILSQGIGSYFDDAFQLPDLESPSHGVVESNLPQAPKRDPTSPADSGLNEDAVPADDKSKMLTCTKIWDRLQSMDKFRSGEIDVDNLCSELRTKARCSESGVVVKQEDVDSIMRRSS